MLSRLSLVERGVRRAWWEASSWARPAGLKGVGSWFASTALSRALLGAFFGLFETVGPTFDGEDLGVMDEAIDKRDDAGGVGKDLSPFGKGPVGGDDGAGLLIAATDELEQEVGMTVGIGEVADLVDHQEAGSSIVAHAPAQRGVAIECGEIPEQLAGRVEEHGVTVDQRLMRDILGNECLADAIGANQDHIGRVFEEVERHQRFDGGTVAAPRPLPVEVAEG